MSKKCTPLWHEAHFQVNMYKTLGVRTTFGDSDVEKVHAIVARSTFRSQNVKSTRVGTTFGGSDVASLRFTRLHYITLHYTPLHYTTLHYTTLHYTTLHSTTLQLQLHNYTPIHYTTLHSTTLNYTTLHYITLHSTTLQYTTLHYTTPHYLPLDFTTIHYTPLHYNYTTTFHYTPLHSTTLNYSTLQCRIAAAECYLCVLNCTKRDTLCQQRVQPRIQKLALANDQIPLSKCQAIPPKKHTMRPPFWESFLNPKMGDHYTPHLLLQ